MLMDDDEEDWIRERTNDIVAIVESRKNEVLSAAQSYLKLVQTSNSYDKRSRQQALLRPAEFIEELLANAANSIAEEESEDDRNTYPEDQIPGKISEYIEHAEYSLELREEYERGDDAGHGRR